MLVIGSYRRLGVVSSQIDRCSCFWALRHRRKLPVHRFDQDWEQQYLALQSPEELDGLYDLFNLFGIFKIFTALSMFTGRVTPAFKISVFSAASQFHNI